MPDTRHGAQLGLPLLRLRVDASLAVGTLEHLDGHYKRILQQVIVHHSVENVDGAVVTSAREQRVLGVLVEAHFTDGFVVVLQRLVRRLTRHIHVEPEHFLVVCAKDEVVALRVHADAGDPFGARAILADNRLLL